MRLNVNIFLEALAHIVHVASKTGVAVASERSGAALTLDPTHEMVDSGQGALALEVLTRAAHVGAMGIIHIHFLV